MRVLARSKCWDCHKSINLETQRTASVGEYSCLCWKCGVIGFGEILWSRDGILYETTIENGKLKNKKLGGINND